MIAHVAESGENSGRVVFQLTAQCEMAPLALAAALRVARSFNAGLESLVTEDPEVIDFARFDFAREVSCDGGRPQSVTVEGFEASLQSLAVLRHGEIATAARDEGVPFHCRTLRDDRASAIAAACFENGPWNVAVLAEAVSDGTGDLVASLFQSIPDVTGFVVVGPTASRTAGPVVAIIEQLAHVQPMLRAAERLASGATDGVHLVLFGGNADETAWMEGQVRLLLGDSAAEDLILAPAIAASAQALATVLKDLQAGFVIAQIDGALLPPGGGLADLAREHDGPLFLIR